MISARLVRRESLTPTITTFWFAPERPLDFLAGQYVDLYLPHDHMDARGANRWFSLSSAPQDTLVGITVRFARRHGSSFKTVLQRLPVGAPVSLGEVLGDFVVPIDRQTPLVFVAAGVGLTPFASMVRDLQLRNDQRSIDLFYAARPGEEDLFKPLFVHYDLRMHITSGSYFNTDDILPNVAEPTHAFYYLAGAEDEVIRLQQALWGSGIRPAHIVLDYFTGYERT